MRRVLSIAIPHRISALQWPPLEFYRLCCRQRHRDEWTIGKEANLLVVCLFVAAGLRSLLLVFKLLIPASPIERLSLPKGL